MPPRLSCLLRILRPHPQPTCLNPILLPQRFHSTPISLQTHYEVLGLDPSASLSAIKKQFYHLSKLHHPDRNRTSSPSSTSPSSEKFIAINTAYATLRNPNKRAAYDKTLPIKFGSGPFATRGADAPYGARPASGLSRRKGVFRGPPPSFYRSRGAGRNPAYESGASTGGASTAGAGAYNTSDAHTSANTNSTGGFSPGQSPYRGSDTDVPHFDREGHFRRQSSVQERVGKRRRRLEEDMDAENEREGGEFWMKFFVVGGVVGLAWLFTSLGMGVGRGNGRKKE